MEEIDVWTNVNLGIVDSEPTRGWTLYYDETNNYRKFVIDSSKKGFVNSEEATFNDFILGGIAVPPGVELDIDGLKKQLGLNQATEMKARNLFGTGDFLYDMGRRRILTFLKWMVDSPLEIHYSTADNLYDAVIEVVDKSLMCGGGTAVTVLHGKMKDALYRYVRNDVAGFLRILHKFGYPEMDETEERRFCGEMAAYVDGLSQSTDDEDAFLLKIVEQNLKAASCSGRTGFLHFGNRNEIIGSYYQNYWYVVLNTPESMHVFDHESRVEHDLEDVQLIDHGEPYDLLKFKDSRECPYIQVADMFVGLLGRTFRWIDNTDDVEINDSIERMNRQQRKSFFFLNELIDRSAAFCPHLIQNMVAGSKNTKRFDTIQRISDTYTNGIL